MEMLAASTLLSLAVVSLCSIGMRSMTGVRSNREYEQAWQLLDRQLTTIEYVGIGQFLEMGQLEGQLGSEENQESVHYWEVQVEEGNYTGLYSVNIAVAWGPSNGRRRITTSTYMYDDSVLELLTESEEQEQE